MDKVQRKYAVDRVNSIERNRLDVLRTKYTTPEKKLSGNEKVALIQSRKAKIVERDRTHNHCNYIEDVFDFAPFQNKESVDTIKYNKDAEPIRKKAQQIRDKIMLGDAEEALKLLTEFES